ncbi:MAG TPA: FecR domain-containing protein [Thermoanaerobaculia bacterium]|nr:FecR domain-containing protein [Thermoanaerobaculia bacterium]
MPPLKAGSPRKDWYSISVDTLKGWIFLLLILAALGLGYEAYRIWDRKAVERQAMQVINQAQVLLDEFKSEPGVAAKSEWGAARQSLEEARADDARGAFREALQGAERSLNLLLAIRDSLRPGASGEAHFVSIQGEVEYRRANGEEWEEARSRVPLHVGDYVRTAGSGSAEIMFSDGNLFTVRPNTQFIVAPSRTADGGGTEQSISMDYGWVDLNTANKASKVKTPDAEARVQQDSEAFVTFDRNSKKARYGSFRGELDLESKGGLKRTVKALQQVIQTGDLLSEPQPLPGRPDPVEPADNLEVDPARTQRLVLAWQPVAGAVHYALQVSRNHLFVDNVINDENRAKTRATLGLRGEGTFQWRVAAYGKDGLQGPWSPPRRFRVASFKTGAGEGDKTPPPLDLEDVKSYGSIVIVGGKTEPGAVVEVNGEQVKVNPDGSFTKTVQLAREGLSLIEIRARDGWGNATARKLRVFVANP